MITTFQPGNRVIHNAHPEYGFGMVRYVEEDAFGDMRLQVAFDHVDNLETVAPPDLQLAADPYENAAAGRWGNISAFRRKILAGLLIGENNLTGGFTKAAIQPLPHQVFLLDKILSADRFGHVLADDVGLGKTIEAGLLITCLVRREPPQRVMVVCPTGLASQWQDELDEHFGLTFSIMGENFDGKLAASWRTQPFVIAPLDRLKREEYRELLKQIGLFDLVVCDEAHRLTAQRRFFSGKMEKTANYQLFEFLVQSRLIRHVENSDRTPRSPRLLLLSATPHQGDDERFVHLLSLARPDLFTTERKCSEQLASAPLSETITRTPKSRAVDWDGRPIFKGHQTVTLDVPWTPEEVDVSGLLTEYILKSIEFARQSDRGTQLVVQLVMHTFHKIAASSWTALAQALGRRLEAIEGKTRKITDLLNSESDDNDDDDSTRDFVLPAKAFFDSEHQLLNKLLYRLRNLAFDSKWSTCVELLRKLDGKEPGVKVLFFTQYRVTQDLVMRQLQGLFPDASVEIVHGDIDMDGRKQARVRFENESRFLVSTEAGGEGVNLHRACHVMINYDLPWNPMRLQQRIGRLDRYGQSHVVMAFNLRVPKSWDHQISTRIMERLEVIQRTMALAGPGESEDYREMILGQIAENVDAARLFTQAQTGRALDDEKLDEWVRGAVKSVDRWRQLFGAGLGLPEDSQRLKPTLTGEHFQLAYKSACEHHSIRFRETRNSANQFVPDVFNFDLPPAFRDPLIRPTRTVHVVFNREIYAVVRGQDLGSVRGQPIHPSLAGFGEPFTDWLFQTSMYARPGESTFKVQAGKSWSRGCGWLYVFALRWLGSRRRLSAPDSLTLVFAQDEGEIIQLPGSEAVELAMHSQPSDATLRMPNENILSGVRKFAQENLRKHLANNMAAKNAAGFSLWMLIAVRSKPESPI